MAKEESTIGGTGTLLGTASLQRALDTLNKSVQSLTTAYSQGKSGTGQGQPGWTNRTAGWAGKDWNAESNRTGTPNGGGSTPPPPQRRGKAYTDELLGGGSGRANGDGPVGNGGHSKIRGAGRVVGAAGLYVAASGMSQLNDRVLMNTTTSMLDRTAVNGSGSRAMFQNNFTSHGIGDTVGAQNTVQSMGYAVGTSGYNSATNYNRTAGLVDPNISQTQAAGAMANMQTGNTFNTLRMFGISTIGPGGKPVSPRDLAHQFITKDFGANKPTTPAGIEASLGQKSRFGQSLNAMVSRGMLDANTASQVTSMMRAELNAGLKGKSYDQYTSILDQYGNKNSTSAAGTKALASIGLTPTDSAKLYAQQAMKTTQLDANNEAFSTGLGAATTMLGQFSNALTDILKGPLGSALGLSQGTLGGGVGTTAGQIGGGIKGAAVAYGGTRLALKVAAKAKGLPVAEDASVLSKVWGGIKTGLGKVGKISGGSSGLGFAPLPEIAPHNADGSYKLDSNGKIAWPEPSTSPIMDLQRKAAQSDYDRSHPANRASSGIDGGAAAGQDRAGGAAAKATGTVGAGKTASNVIAIAKKYLGIPYHYGGASPQQGFDCSGLMQYVFRQVGVNLPRVSQAQQTAGKPVNPKDARPGDLVFFGGNAKSGGAHHVAMMVSSGQIIEAAHTGTNVRIRSFSMSEISTVGRFLGSMGSMSTDAVANTDGASSKTGSGASAGSSFASSFFGNALNEMDTLGGTLGSFLGSTSPSGSGKGNGATKAASGTGGTSTAPSGSIKDTLSKAGFSGSSLNMAYAMMMAESQGNARAHNGNAATGDNSYGWFQINMLGKMGPERLKQYHLSSNEDLFNTATNSRVAYEMSGGGKNWSDWSTYKNGDYKKYLGGAQKGYAGGSTNIDVDQDARVHKGEMILPTQQAEAVRAALAGNNLMSAVTGLGGKGVQITFGKESIKIILGTGVTSAMGTKVGRQIVDTIVNDRRLSDIAKGVA